MTKQNQSHRLPIRSAETGDTLALMSKRGLELWSKRKKRWEPFSLTLLTQLYEEVTKPEVAKPEESA